jgi:hypothetical protein
VAKAARRGRNCNDHGDSVTGRGHEAQAAATRSRHATRASC